MAALQNFVAFQEPAIGATWLNQVDVFVNTLFQAATTPTHARTAIAAAAAGVNADITALTALSGPVKVGGTGGTSGQVLTSSGDTTAPTWATPLTLGVNGMLKGASGAFQAAVAGTDYAPPTSGSSLLYGNGSGGFSNVTIGSNLSFAGGTLSATSGSGTVTSVNASGGTTGLSFSGGPVTASGTLTLAGTLAVANGGTGQTTANAALNALLPTQASQAGKVLTTNGTDTSWTSVGGTGTVTSVAMSVPTFLAVSGSPITSAGTFAVTLSGTALPVLNGGTGVTTSTGSGANVLGTSPTLSTPTIDAINGGAVSGLKEKIINGRMEIDQRNSGAAINFTANAGAVYGLDRMQYYSYSTTNTGAKGTLQRNAGSVTPPAGFVNYWGLTSSTSLVASATDVHVLGQRIEGVNIADLAQGSASAKDFTISFWVRASQAGNYGGALFGGGLNYVFPYSISAANTWEKKSVLIPGCTTGPWVTDTGTGLNLFLDVGSGTSSKGASGSWGATNLYGVTGGVSVLGTSGATFYITGLSLKAGDCRNELYNEWRPYALEEVLCMRYFEKSYQMGSAPGTVSVQGCLYTIANANISIPVTFKVRKRATPTMTFYSVVTGASGAIRNYTASADITSVTDGSASGESGSLIYKTGGATLGNEIIAHWTASAEL